MSTVWIRGQEEILVRADAIIMLACAPDGLHAECVTGRTVRLADSERPGILQLALLDEIRRAGADERLVVVITPPAERDSATWRREYADILLQRLTEDDGR
jgi:hypothetical protein